VELNFGCPHPAMMPGVHGGGMIGQVRPTWRPR
jgi:hypothetical protein